MNSETIILSHLRLNEPFARKVLPFIKSEYFSNASFKCTYTLLEDYVNKYKVWPTKEALLIDLSNKTGLNENVFNNSKETIIDVKIDKSTSEDWLIDLTETFCKERAMHNALIQAIKIVENDKSENALTLNGIPKLMNDAISISFDTSVGHDFVEDADKRYDFYHLKQNHIPFDMDTFNTITNGGLINKTLNVLMAITGGGKSRFMCHCASTNLRDGKNVLYITLEMAEERIAERIDANLLDIPINELSQIPKQIYENKINRLRETTKGKLIIKEYPTASAGANHFRYLLNELKLKKNFKPDIIYIDYINICCSSRLKMGANVNSYSYIKSIAEELRGLAVEFDLPVVTATQINRSGFNSSDLEMENISESIGLPATCDILFALIVNEELDNLNQILVKQLKNRYSDPTTNRRFCIGVDKPKMRLFDLENPKEGLMKEEDQPVFDQTTFSRKEFDSKKFEDFI